MAGRIVNLGEWRAHLLHDVAAQVDASGDETLQARHEELTAYPGQTGELGAHEVFVPQRIRSQGNGDGELRFLSTRTAVDVTVSELAIESFFPADAATAEVVRSYSASR
jgi:hypothetical protein